MAQSNAAASNAQVLISDNQELILIHSTITPEWLLTNKKYIHIDKAYQRFYHKWLDYKFQALWFYEIAWKYPFLYDYGRYDDELINKCIESSLFTNYFLHFAGSWHECNMWKLGKSLKNTETQKQLEDFHAYLQIPVTGEPKGQIKPKA